MNYAQDALWWKLKSPHVRALASLLTAPALWQTDSELSVRTLLGEAGFRFLLQLDDEPCRLPAHLIAHTADGAAPRLGHYAEDLLAFWLDNAPHSRLLAREVKIRADDGRDVGALDFVAQLNGECYHIELACKYYGGAGSLHTMFGLNVHDTLLNKQHKLQQQMVLSALPSAQRILRDFGSLHRVSVVRGMGFTPSGVLPDEPPYAVNAWSGILLDDVAQWRQFAADARFYPLLRHEYLAPARVLYEQTRSHDEMVQAASGLYALVLPRSDGCWHETQRVMYRLKS